MRKIILIICSMFMLSGYAWADEEEEVDTVKVPFFNGVALHVDLAGPITHVFDDGDGHYEMGVRVNLLDKFFPAAEAAMSIEGKPFFRVGVDYNVLKKKHDKYKLFVGARYGFGKFDYNHPGSVPENMKHWPELLIGTDMTVVGPFHLGWDFRWRKGGFLLLYYLTFAI